MIVCGPNAEGFIDISGRLAATFSPTVLHGSEGELLDTGHGESISIASQSGGVGFSFYNRGVPLGLSFSFVISTGNEVSVELLDVVDYLVADDNTGIILLFLEGIRTPEKLAAVAGKAASAAKPVIAAKMGRSRVAAAAAASHTGSLTGSQQVYEAVLRHHGVILGDDSDQMLAIAAAFAHFGKQLPGGRRVGILSASGGGAIWMTDACEAAGLETPELDAPTQDALRALMPAYGAARNPVDITAQGVYAFGYAKPLEILCASPVVDSVICVVSLVNPDIVVRDRAALRALREHLGKPVIFCSYTLPHPEAVEILARAGFPCLSRMPDSASALVALCDFREFLGQYPGDAATPRVAGEVTRILADNETIVHEHAAKSILVGYGMTVGRPLLARTPREAVDAAATFGTPVVLKVLSPDIPHKHRAGGVRLDLRTPREIQAAYESVIRASQSYLPDADILGALVEPLADAGVEMIVGISTDPEFGPMLLVGYGGLMVETRDDVQLSPCPVNRIEAFRLLRLLGIDPPRQSTRDAHPFDADALVDLMVRLSELACAHHDDIKEIDLNPVIVHPQGLTIADALIVKHGRAGNSKSDQRHS